jgi:hypothetical protein
LEGSLQILLSIKDHLDEKHESVRQHRERITPGDWCMQNDLPDARKSGNDRHVVVTVIGIKGVPIFRKAFVTHKI